MSEHNEQPSSEKPVQTIKKPAQNKHKGRTRAEKEGRLKYTLCVLKKVLDEIQQVKATQRVILNGWKGAGIFHYDVPLIQRFACSDAVDADIVEVFKEAGNQGMFPKDAAAKLPQYKLEYYDVSRRIVRMNRRLQTETGELLFEKRGHRWALTRFGFEVYGASDASDVEDVHASVEDSEEDS